MENFVGGICPLCKKAIAIWDRKIICPVCGIPQHQECWDNNMGCSTWGCAERSGEPLGSNIADANEKSDVPNGSGQEVSLVGVTGESTSANNVCRKCEVVLQEDQEFCTNCGTRKGADVNNVCDRCGSVLKADQEFCSKCGQKIELSLERKVALSTNKLNATSSTVNTIISCPECKKEISDSATSCPHCGYPLNRSKIQGKRDVSKKPLKKYLIISGSICGGILILLVLMSILSNGLIKMPFVKNTSEIKVGTSVEEPAITTLSQEEQLAKDKVEAIQFVKDYFAALAAGDEVTLNNLGGAEFGAECYFGNGSDDPYLVALAKSICSQTTIEIDENFTTDGSTANINVVVQIPDPDSAISRALESDYYGDFAASYCESSVLNLINGTEMDITESNDKLWSQITYRIDNYFFDFKKIEKQISLVKDKASGEWKFSNRPIEIPKDANSTGIDLEKLWKGCLLALGNLKTEGKITETEYTDYYAFLDVESKGWFDTSQEYCDTYVSFYTSPDSIGYSVKFHEPIPGGVTLHWTFFTDYEVIGTYSQELTDDDYGWGRWIENNNGPGVYHCIVSLDDGYTIAGGDVNVW